MILKRKENLTFVIYQDQGPTKCFEINKNLLKFFSLGLPFFFIVLILFLLIIFAYFKNIKPSLTVQLPTTTSTSLKSEAKSSKENIEKALLETDQSKTLKVATVPMLFSIFTPVKGQKDLTSQSLINVENPKLIKRKNTLNFQFDLRNPKPNVTKISGHIFVLFRQGSHFYIYPSVKKKFKDGISQFQQGETFTVSRFRPVKVEFPRLSDNSSAIDFTIFLFSRAGNLLVKKEIGPYNP